MTQAQVISYPTPYFNNNIPIVAENYAPSRFVISNVTLGQTTIITTSVDHDYVIGQLIRLFIPKGYGCIQLNQKSGYVISIPSTTKVEVLIDSSQNVNQFIAASETNSPAIMAVGDTNTGTINSNGRTNLGTTIPGAFINIS
jgi:hypothetical protein